MNSPGDDNGSMIAKLRDEVVACRRCPLSETRHRVIFGEGNPRAPIMVIGEGPGKDEDIQGRPFIGKSGQLLDKILLACNFTREKHVFISNIVKCRPPGNRPPTDQEAKVCMPWLYQQIDLVNPHILVLLGATSLRYMLGNQYRITRVRGTWLTWFDKLVMPVFHPAALLRNPALKRPTWEDYKKIFHKYREVADPAHTSVHIPVNP